MGYHEPSKDLRPSYDKLEEAMSQYLRTGLPLTVLTSQAYEIGDDELVDAFQLIVEHVEYSERFDELRFRDARVKRAT